MCNVTACSFVFESAVSQQQQAIRCLKEYICRTDLNWYLESGKADSLARQISKG